MRVVFIDVGKGDCILVFNHEFAFMIDTGNNNVFDKLNVTLEKYSIKKLDVLILTHPHLDHTGSYEHLKSRISIDKVYMSKCMIIKENDSMFEFLKAGDKLLIGTCLMHVFSCKRRYKNLNDYSIIIKLLVGSISFLFMGDATCLSENEVLASNYDLKCDILKVGHHGQKDASCMRFLEKALPQYSIISTDDESSISPQVIDRLLKINSEILVTGKNGDIEFDTDGEKILLRCERSDDSYVKRIT